MSQSGLLRTKQCEDCHGAASVNYCEECAMELCEECTYYCGPSEGLVLCEGCASAMGYKLPAVTRMSEEVYNMAQSEPPRDISQSDAVDLVNDDTPGEGDE